MSGAVDLRRQPFGQWLVLYKGEPTVHGPFWVCQCACTPAVTVALHEQALLEGWTRSCGCAYVTRQGVRQPVYNWVGRQVGQRLVLSRAPAKPSTKEQGVCYWCRCRCQGEGVVPARRLAAAFKHARDLVCGHCAQRGELPPRWYTPTLFVEKALGAVQGHAVYGCQFADGSRHTARGTDIAKGRVRGIGRGKTYGDVVQRGHEVLVLRSQGLSQARIARMVGVTQSAISHFLRCHAKEDPLRQLQPRGVVASHIDHVMAWLHAGISQSEIGRRLGVGPSAVRHFLDNHSEYRALVASMAPDEDLVSEVP